MTCASWLCVRLVYTMVGPLCCAAAGSRGAPMPACNSNSRSSSDRVHESETCVTGSETKRTAACSAAQLVWALVARSCWLTLPAAAYSHTVSGHSRRLPGCPTQLLRRSAQHTTTDQAASCM